MIACDTPWLEKGDKLICFGDSLTAAPDGYVKILEAELKKRRIAVVNAGRGGDKTPWALTRLYPAVIEAKPDAVLIFLGTNDAAVGRGVWADEPRIEPAVYKGNLRWIVHLCRLAGIKKFSIATPTCFEGPALLNTGDVLPAYQLAAREAADEAGARLVPLDAVFARETCRHRPAAALTAPDGTHMTPAGNKLIAAAMLDAWFPKPPNKA